MMLRLVMRDGEMFEGDTHLDHTVRMIRQCAEVLNAGDLAGLLSLPARQASSSGRGAGRDRAQARPEGPQQRGGAQGWVR